MDFRGKNNKNMIQAEKLDFENFGNIFCDINLLKFYTTHTHTFGWFIIDLVNQLKTII